MGGAVRDALLGEPAGERDWVVVGGTAETLLARGYRQVGKDFPVFLHPETHEEYALARTERKSAPGYTGFEVCADPTVTLEEDLKRRDLTINAIAQHADGHLVDPYGGQQDIESRLLRHVSPAFREDPVRILRLARFAARFHRLGFTVDATTTELLREMVNDGEAAALVPERVWRETERALATDNPEVFFQVLHACGALAIVFPELAAAPRGGDALSHGADALTHAALCTSDTEIRFAALLHSLGDEVQTLCARLGAPNRYRDLALAVARHSATLRSPLALEPEAVIDLLEQTDALRRADRFEKLVTASEVINRNADAQSDHNPGKNSADLLRLYRSTAHAVTAAELANEHSGAALGQALRAARVAAITNVQAKLKKK